MRRQEAGVTLVELMIGTVILFLVASAAISLTVVFMRSFALHQRMVIVERSGRVSLEVIADALRNASPAVPSGQIGDLSTCATPGAFRIVPGADGPDELEVVHASGAVVTSLRQPFTADSTALVVADAGALAVDDLVVVSNLTRGHVAKITNIQQVDGEWRLATTAPSACSDPGFPGGGYPQGSLIVRARISRFFIGEFLGVPTLMVDTDGDGPVEAEPLADGIEDLQVAVGIDIDGGAASPAAL